MSDELRLVLLWFIELLEAGLVEARSWCEDDSEPARLFVDARSTPPRCAAVLFVDGRRFWTDAEPAAEVMARFAKRDDGQITSLELLAISMAMSTFSAGLTDRKVVVYSDNSGAEARSTPLFQSVRRRCAVVCDSAP